MENIKKARKLFRSPALFAIINWSKPVRWGIIGISVISVISALLSLGLTLVTKALVDAATGGIAGLLWRFGALMVILYAVQRGLSVWMSLIQMRTSAGLQRYLQGLVTKSILGKEYGSLKTYHSGELVNRVFSDVSVIKNGMINLLPTLLTTMISFFGAAVILLSWDWRFVPVMIVAALIGSFVMIGFREPMKKRHKRMQAAEDALHSSTQETFENIRLVKASVSEDRVLSHIDNEREHLVFEQMHNGKLSIAFNGGMGVVFDVSRLICYLWGCVKIYQKTFTYGSLAALLSLVGRIQTPIANGMRIVSQAYGVMASAERLLEVIGLPNEDKGEMLSSFDAIEMKNACFQYDDGVEDVLLDVTAIIHRGDFVAMTGISGGGKTSLFQLLLGIYRPTSGEIVFVDGGKKINACRGTRGLFAYVPQGNTLMSGTLRDNLTMFTNGVTEAAIAAAIHAACLDDVVAEIGLDAKLGERGIGLSEGQAQRVAIARALLSDAPILLLDEATSALDEGTEAKLLSNIDAMRDKTVIIVTHRRAALQICDYQLHLENGHLSRKEALEE